MLEHKVDSKDVHVLENSPNTNAPARCQISDHDVMLTFLISFIILATDAASAMRNYKGKLIPQLVVSSDRSSW